MAEGLLRSRLADRGIDGAVSSTGISFTGHPASDHSVESMRVRGIDITGHRSRLLDRQQIAAADLVLGMARSHVREAVLLDPRSFPRVFTLKELVRRAELIGSRPAAESEAEWLHRAGSGRRPTDHLGASATDDVADPYGGPWEEYEDTADELQDLIDRLVDLLWPDDRAAVDLAPTEARA